MQKILAWRALPAESAEKENPDAPIHTHMRCLDNDLPADATFSHEKRYAGDVNQDDDTNLYNRSFAERENQGVIQDNKDRLHRYDRSFASEKAVKSFHKAEK